MSIEPHWFSTIYGLLFIAGQGLSALAFCIALLVILSREGGPLEGVIGPAHLHDIGKLMLTFTMLWAYFSYSQFLIIWSGNLATRSRGTSSVCGAAGSGSASAGGIHFALPFACYSRSLKRSGVQCGLPL